MQLTSKLKLLVSGLLVLCLVGCTTVNPYTGQREMSKSTAGAGIGAIGGALLGAAIGGGRGALVGAAIGGVGGAAIGHSMDYQDTMLRQRLVGTGVQVYRDRRTNTIQLVMNSDVTFRLNSAAIRSGLYPALDSVAIVLRKYRKTNVMIYGFTDNTGSAAYNQTLSEHRAGSVRNYLISQGVSRYRLFAKGYGERHPIASNKTVRGRHMNRRVVIELRPMG